METCATDNDGSYAACLPGELVKIDPQLEEVVGSGELVIGFERNGYTISVVANETDTRWEVEKLGAQEARRTCNQPRVGSCPASGRW
jgi:hypothetical protein